MFDEADAFVALPGGFGTLEELFEMVRKKRKLFLFSSFSLPSTRQKLNSLALFPPPSSSSYQITWQQLGFHTKPVGVLNCSGFYDKLLSFFDDAVSSGFVGPASRAIVVDAPGAAALLDALAEHRPPPPVITLSETLSMSVDVMN